MEYDLVLDSMLGKTARWLRVLGYSVYYDPSAPDSELVRIAREEGCVLVTRDRGLRDRAEKEGIRVVYLELDSNEEILRYLSRELGIRLSIDLSKTRCPKCNGELRRAGKREVEGLVEGRVLERYDELFLCENCGAIYWPGKQFRSMKAILERLSKSPLPGTPHRSAH